MRELKKETSTHYLCDICVETTANQSKQYTITEHDALAAPLPLLLLFKYKREGVLINGRPLVEKFLVPAGAGRFTTTTTNGSICLTCWGRGLTTLWYDDSFFSQV